MKNQDGPEKDLECMASVSTPLVKKRTRRTKSFCSLTLCRRTICHMGHRPSTPMGRKPRLNLRRIISPQYWQGNRRHTEDPRSKIVVRVQDGSSIGAFMPAQSRVLDDIALLTQTQHSSMWSSFSLPSASRMFGPVVTKGVRGRGT
jgi:hypothetical protein